MKQNKKVLIIDDEAYIRRVIELKLKKQGYQVFTARNGEEGLNLFKTHQPEVVITDLKMPKLDGKGFCELTNAFKKQRTFLTIIISCSIPGDGMEWVDGLQDTLFLEKPFSPSKLLTCIDQYFEEQNIKD